ncbi:dual 3',5'-cyclic-AMP and -GMP phosphodiesterase 11 isoform X2 [Drosophila albomicans]|uniref:Phosphodiesterase n=1 Tax=Drosophila albomicans TaxID=7291 RepID=A0A6P8WQX1_DROAB|nr:dual 3',5'-cyclic-AMP and -GMP phosphodiesterase 11 isoform X2 [Drosophila albomicans]XP_034100560.1 dual 3',5'-cyclic-AMP and -GMP phosphodiesterase 11 isoform X2 [Drosophila albomicans]XP_051858644.1 dual 3',5'-cyclic-AMP and -GMP phosphodiesterase 11 isoform X2 [Drosophila albomicans]XP_051858645.1 dual 3',5'-cyclic-AMP and -GMP phosphodiesterase 11 isoform X2 [Drosophila albomicans]XP_051858646.1 dual 3',5'-cyclic-AMP and -GMP phosphodiesterase 11 isoform X2 [Drosophila albomicans]
MASSPNQAAPPVLWRARRKIGLHLRSIEEPASTPLQLAARMPAEQGGTGYGMSEHSLLIATRTSVPLPLSQQQQSPAHYQYNNSSSNINGNSSNNINGGSNHTATTGGGYVATTAAAYQQHSQQQQQQQQQQQSPHLLYHHQLQQQQQQHLQHQYQGYSHQYHQAASPQHSRPYDPEHARMEAWMDENQEFVQDYFIRKATRQTVDAWLVSHATTAGNDVISSNSPTHPNGQTCSSRGGSGATTPVRKISAHEFERGGLLKPIVNTIDGTPTFLSIGPQLDNSSGSCSNLQNVGGVVAGQYQYQPQHHHHYHHNHPHYQHSHYQAGGAVGSSTASGSNSSNANNAHNATHNNAAHMSYTYPYHCHQRPQRLSRNELKQLDEKELIFELVKDICNELEVRTLCHKILQNVSILLNADRGSLFLVQGRCNGADGLKKCLVSKLFDVCPRSTVEEMEQQEEVRVAWGTGIAGHVAESGEPVNIPDAYQDERFNCEIDSLTGYRTKALLCMPIKDSGGDVIGVAQVINKMNGECFSEIDEKVFASYLQFCGIGLRNAQLFEKSQLEIKRNQVLLDLARMIFEEQSTIEHMVFRILTHMQSLIQCQRVQILLVHEADKGSFSRVFDFEANDLSEDEANSRTSPYESRFPINIGITGHVATTGETVNVPNAYEDDRFDASVDDNSSFKHRSILCMAIKNSLGQIIGVIQLINKFNELDFTKNDENFVEAFAIFCGMGIHNTHMYEKAIVAMAKQSVTLEVLSYHASATMDEAHRLRRLRVPSAVHFHLHDFKFDDIHFEDDDTLKACLRMFLDLDFVERFHIDYEVLCRWLLSVKKNYRNVTYHNWRHAFNVAQMMFAILTTTQWWKIFGEIECLALIIGCLCHDLDHRGTNNSFQIKASSPLAQLYSTSTMEHHHFDQCLMILNSPGNQILANLSSDDYCRVIRVLEDAILSTDLAVYFKKRGPFLESVQEPLNYWATEEPRALLRAMSMTVCDLSAITKPWEIEKRVADLVSSEFFEQGDMEKQELNITPIDIMNREKEDELPMMQVNFIDSICLPIYEAFAVLSDKLEPLVDGVRDNRGHWIDMADDVKTKTSQDQQPKAQQIVIANGDSKQATSDDSMVDNVVDAADGAESEAAAEADACVNGLSVDKSNATTNNIAIASRPSSNQPTSDDDDDVNDVDDDDDGEVVDVDTHMVAQLENGHASNSSNSSCMSSSSSSTVSSRLSTPPPTGEDDSTPVSPSKTLQAKLVAANLNALSQGKATVVAKPRCKNCDQTRMQVRKTSSLKGTQELNGCAGNHKKDVALCKSTPAINHQHNHNHNHNHHNHHNNHHHHHHHSHTHSQHNQNHIIGGGIGSASIGGSGLIGLGAESDKIPKIVGKLGNLDGLTFTNGHGLPFNYPQQQLQQHHHHLLARRHSETNNSNGLAADK